MSRPNVVGGNQNHLFVSDGAIVEGLNVIFEGEDSCLIIEEGAAVSGDIHFLSSNCVVRIGKNTRVDGGTIYCGEGSSIILGDNCILEAGVKLISYDGVSIYNLSTMSRENISRTIVINDSVLVGAGTLVLKGAALSHGSIVEENSLVKTGCLANNVLLSGRPAQVVREGVTWVQQ